MSEGPDDAVQQEKEMREHEREGRERAAGGEGGRDPGEDPNSTTPATIQTGNVSGS